MEDDRTVASEQVLRAWDDRSSVRSKPRRIASELESGKSLFPRSLLPIVNHEILAHLCPETINSLLNLRLFLYLDFTTSLEQEVVNPALVDISKGLAGLEFSKALRLDAHRIYVDEGYHALAAVDLMQQISGMVATPYTRVSQHKFVAKLQKIVSSVPQTESRLAVIAAATVSETLISGTLSQIPQDESVVQVVRQAVAEHADDERTHHAYFSRLHEAVWPRLPRSQQRLLAPLYADFILDFLRPDTENLKSILQQAGVAEDSARRVVNETYESADPLPGIRHAARATIRLLQRTGVLEITEARDKFEAEGLVA
jgi:hypothetical protein